MDMEINYHASMYVAQALELVRQCLAENDIDSDVLLLSAQDLLEKAMDALTSK